MRVRTREDEHTTGLNRGPSECVPPPDTEAGDGGGLAAPTTPGTPPSSLPPASEPSAGNGAPPRVVVEILGLAPKSPNRREHYLTKARRVRRERRTVREALKPFAPVPPPWRVVLVRVAPRLLDDDNATASMKAVRDTVAEWLHVDDGDTSRVRFVVEQERGPYAVRVAVEGAP